ncbi:MAG TPA: DUF6152 family protein [Bryobacteraceae bacterium]|jgi:hypothetical protein
MRLNSFTVLAVLGAALAAAPVMAHHSFAAEYDSKKPVKLTGTITKIDWMNPHVYFFMDVEDDSGKVTSWGFEMGPPNLLQKSGWTRNTMKIGDVVIVDGTLAKDGTNQGNARTITLASTGKRLGAASSENTNP